jgi:hypothetical protein
MFRELMILGSLLVAVYLGLITVLTMMSDEEVDTEHPTYCMKCGDYEGRI